MVLPGHYHKGVFDPPWIGGMVSVVGDEADRAQWGAI